MIISYTKTYHYIIDTKNLEEFAEDENPETMTVEELQKMLSYWTQSELIDICEDFGVYEEVTTI